MILFAQCRKAAPDWEFCNVSHADVKTDVQKSKQTRDNQLNEKTNTK